MKYSAGNGGMVATGLVFGLAGSVTCAGEARSAVAPESEPDQFTGALVSLIPVGGNGNEISVEPGSSVTVEVFVSDVTVGGSPKLRGYQVTLPVEASGGLRGSVHHDGNLPVIDAFRPDYVYFQVAGVFPVARLDPFPAVAAASQNVSVEVTDPKYCGEFVYVVSQDAVGVFTLDVLDPGVEQGDLSFLTDENSQPFIFKTAPAVFSIPCSTDTDCDDNDPCNGVEACGSEMTCEPGSIADCNGNLIDDGCDVDPSDPDGNGLVSLDCNTNEIPDECENDCNANNVPDDCDVDPTDPDGDGFVSADCDANDIPDECETDCNANNVPDDCDVDPTDPDGDGLVSSDCNANRVPDECEPDCNANDIPDQCDISSGTSQDCNGNTLPDECDMQAGSPDCNQNGLLDECDLADCSADPACADCNGNGVPDGCDIADGTSLDVDPVNGVPDECEACERNIDCDDGDLCTFDVCTGSCENTPALYGDLSGRQGDCGPDGRIDIFDIFAVLNGFRRLLSPGCELSNIDIAGTEGSCAPDGVIDIFDIFAVADAFQGRPGCCGG